MPDTASTGKQKPITQLGGSNSSSSSLSENMMELDPSAHEVTENTPAKQDTPSTPTESDVKMDDFTEVKNKNKSDRTKVRQPAIIHVWS